MDRGVRLRLQLVILGVLAALGALAARCYWIALRRHDHYVEIADQQQLERYPEYAIRGEIRDREGRLLAITRMVPSLSANPRVIADPKAVARALAKVLGRPMDDILGRLVPREDASGKPAKAKHFVWLARHLEPAQAQAVRALKIEGLELRDEPRRYYPHGAIAAHAIGFCGIDGGGLEGVERAFDGELAGTHGAFLHVRDALRGQIRMPDALGSPARDGSDVELTLDLAVQRIAEEELQAAVDEFPSQRAVAIVLDAPSGEILALACRPNYDPNDFGAAGRDAWRNTALVDAYEPGSTFKPLVAAVALEHKLFNLNATIDCHQGHWQYRGRTLHDAHGMGVVSFAEVVVHSSNIGMAQIGLAIGEERLQRYLTIVGCGREPEGLPSLGASPGKITPKAQWSYYTQTSVPMGHEILVSPIQLAGAINVLAADGLWLPPRLVRAVTPAGGARTPVGASLARARALSRDTAEAMRGVMERVVEEGTGKRAQLTTVSVGGKTGTAQKIMPGGVYSHDHYVSSFVGFAPVDRPRVTVLVLLDDPVLPGEKPYGGRVAAPAASRIIQRALAYLGESP